MKYENPHLGSDANHDRHCDLCGRFVDARGHHKAAFVFTFAKDIERTGEYYDIVFDGDILTTKQFIEKYYKGQPYNILENDTHWDWWMISEYTENDGNNPFSSPSINRYLRNNESWNDDIEERVFRINNCIDKFELKEDLVLYRGFSVDSNSEFAHTLEKAYHYTHEYKEPYEFIDMGFLSTTRDPFYAKRLSRKGEGDVKVYCSIAAKKGTRCMPLNTRYGTTINNIEKEVLFKAFRKDKIMGIEMYKIGNITYYNIEILVEGD